MYSKGSRSADSPDPAHQQHNCLKEYTSDWRAVVDNDKPGCKDAEYLEDNILVGSSYWNPRPEIVGPYSEVDENGRAYIYIFVDVKAFLALTGALRLRMIWTKSVIS